MYLIILFEGRFIRFYQVDGGKGRNYSVSKSSIVDLEGQGILGDDVYKLDKLVPIIKNEIKVKAYKKKNVKLLINNRQLIYRELTVPQGDATQLQTMVSNEMILSLNLSNDYVVSYIDLGEVSENNLKMRRVFATAILEQTCQDYLNLMKKCDLKCISLQAATDNLVQYLRKLNKDETVLYLECNLDVLRNYLFENGDFVLSRTNRLEENENLDNESFMQILSENIAKMDQFQFTRNRYQSITKIEVFGNNPALENFEQFIFETNRPIVLIEKPKEVAFTKDYYESLAAVCILFEGNSTGFLSLIKSTKKNKEKITNRDMKRVYKTTILCVVFALLTTAGCFGYRYYLNMKLDEKYAYIESMQEDYDKAAKISNVASTYGAIKDQALFLRYEKENVLKFSKEISDLILNKKSEAIKLNSTSFENGIIEISANAPGPEDCAHYAKLLQNSKVFEAVTYEGFAGGDGSYSFTLTLMMKGAVIADEVE